MLFFSSIHLANKCQDKIVTSILLWSDSAVFFLSSLFLFLSFFLFFMFIASLGVFCCWCCGCFRFVYHCCCFLSFLIYGFYFLSYLHIFALVLLFLLIFSFVASFCVCFSASMLCIINFIIYYEYFFRIFNPSVSLLSVSLFHFLRISASSFLYFSLTLSIHLSLNPHLPTH